MIRIWVWALLAAISAASPAIAETVAIRSGQHAGFSRLYLDFPGAHDWEFGRTGAGLEFRSSLPDLEYELEGALDFVDRSRIGLLTQRPNRGLYISLNCTCHGDILELDGGDIVIDIKDGPAPAQWEYAKWLSNGPSDGAKTESNVDIATLESGQIPNEMTPALTPSIRPTTDSGLFSEVQWSPMTLPETEGSPMTSGSTEGASFGSDLFGAGRFSPFLTMQSDATDPSRADELRDVLLSQFQRAAAQGLVRPVQNAIPSVTPLSSSETSDQNTLSVEPENPPPDPSQISNHLDIETSVDRSLPGLNALQGLSGLGSSCHPPHWFDPNQWVTSPRNFDLEGLRAQLFEEFDKPDLEAAKAIVYHYLYFGFGLEARQTAMLFLADTDIAEYGTLQELSYLLDNEYDHPFPNILSQSTCENGSEIWAVLGDPSQILNPDLRLNNVLARFSGLPEHLRAQFGPRLVKAMLDQNLVKEALSLKNMMARSAFMDPTALSEVSALFTEDELGIEAASAEYQEIAREDGPNAAEALATLIEGRLSEGLPVDSRDAASADALSVEYRGTALGSRLTKASIRAFSVAGEPGMTFQRIDDALANGSISDDEAVTLRLEAFRDAAAKAEETAFLRMTYSKRPLWPESVAEGSQALLVEARVAVANRLTELGFFHRALETVDGIEPTQNSDIALIRARADVAAGRQASALDWIGTRTDPAALEIRNAALEGMGKYQDAAAGYSETGNTYRQALAAWLSGDMNNIAQVGSAQQSEFATLANDAQPEMASDQMTDVQISLQEQRGRLSQSAALREMVDGLMRTQAGDAN